MGDARYETHLAEVRERGAASLGELTDDEVIQALAALAARRGGPDAYLANVLASEAMNRLARGHAAATHSSLGLLTVDLEGVGLYANRAAERLLGWKQSELRGTHIHTLIHDPDRERPCFIEEGLAANAPTRPTHTTLTRKDGTKVDVELSTGPVQRDGDKTGSVITFHATAQRDERSDIATPHRDN